MKDTALYVCVTVLQVLGCLLRRLIPIKELRTLIVFECTGQPSKLVSRLLFVDKGDMKMNL